MADHRVECDLLGERPVPATALWGIHTARAVENFPLALRPVHAALVHAYGAVKLAAARTNHELGRWDAATFAAIEAACREMMSGQLDAHVIVDALQGGAGTSTNMNINEVLANRTLQRLGRAPGDYTAIDPLGDINLHQSTNDTYPTALKVAAIEQLHALERHVTSLVEAFQGRERAFACVVKVARTQLQDAVLITLGRQFGAYADALARDRWRIDKCQERLRVVNLGGTAVGTGLGAPRQYIFRVVDHLRDITGIGLARSENLIDATQNLDAIVEVSGIIRTLATNLLKITSDLRLLASGPEAGFGEITLEPRQAGSSMMPGKVNPVILEAVGQAALAVLGHDHVLTHAAASGNLELNQFMPLIADSLLAELTLLQRACETLDHRCIRSIRARVDRCRAHVAGSTATLTALVDRLGYEAAQQIARAAREGGRPIRQLVLETGRLTAAEFDELTSPAAVTRLGSTPPDGA